MDTQTITREQLIGRLLGVTGAAPVTVTAKTDAKARKNPHGKIFKIRRVNGMVGFQYEAGVLRRLAKEGKSPEDFKKGTSWHEPVIQDGHLTPLCQNKKDKSKAYLRMMMLKAIGEEQFVTESGREVGRQEIEEFLPTEKPEGQNQGLDEPLLFRVYDIENIEEISLGGEHYKVQ